MLAGVIEPPCGIRYRRMYERTKAKAIHIPPYTTFRVLLAEEVGIVSLFLDRKKIPPADSNTTTARTIQTSKRISPNFENI